MSATVIILVLVTTAVLLAAAAVLREVVTDDPRHSRGYVPPRSHPLDEFERTGSSYC